MVPAAKIKGSGAFKKIKGSDPFIPAAVAEWADQELARLPLPGKLTGAQLLSERAAISGYVSRGATAPGGSCRLLETADGGIALNLAREDDWALLPAWLEGDVAADWGAVERAVRSRCGRELVQRGREMGLAVAVDEVPAESIVGAPLWRDRRGDTVAPERRSYKKPPRVIDLSSLWAGPLCGHLLQQLGAQVVKVESLHRPDGARRGPSTFFDLLNAGKASVALDFTTAEGRSHLAALIDSADILIEASRPRALRQLGIAAEAIYARRPGLIWLSITAYGRAPATANWIGYGDDVGVAAGLSALVRAKTGERRFVGDAIADPLTGIHAANLAWQAWRSGAGGLIDISLYATARRAAEKWARTPAYQSRPWGAPTAHRPWISQPRQGLRAPAGIARELGADTVVQLREAARAGAGETAYEATGESDGR